MRTKFKINDNWLFSKDNKTYEHVNLPHTWNNFDGQGQGNDFFRGECHYRKIFEYKKKNNKNIFLEFEGAYSVTKVYLNGEFLGEHKGGFSTFRFDLSDIINDGENSLEVSVDNRHYEDVYPLLADFTFFGGIYRNVSLIEVGMSHFSLSDDGSDGVYVSQVQVDNKLAKIRVDAIISNKENESVNCKVAFYDKDDCKIVESDVNGETDIIISNPHLWNGVKDPYLYKTVFTLYDQNEVIDEVVVNTGLRQYSFDSKKGLYLNGEHYKLKGVARHQDRLDKGWAINVANQAEDMEIIKEMGANSIRLSHYQHSQYFYDLCDREGMVVWAEIPFISSFSETDKTGRNALNQMKELVKQNYNHSSIFMWGVHNEITIAASSKEDFRHVNELVKKLNEQTKKLDPYRPTVQAQLGAHSEEDELNYITDIIAYNKYYGWYSDEVDTLDTWLTDVKNKNLNLCLGISEYGAEGILKYQNDTPHKGDYSETYQTLYHENTLNVINKHPELWGTYVWNMFDFASIARDEGGVKGRNNKGLVTYDRSIKKDAFYMYKAHWSDEPFIHICDKRYIRRHNRTIDIKVYTNQESITLYVNGKALETQKAINSKVVFMNIKLTWRTNIKVFGGECSDSASFTRCLFKHRKYILPKNAKVTVTGDNIKNWFEDFELEDEGEMKFPVGYFSIEDKIEDIMETQEGADIIKKYMGTSVDHPMFSQAKKMSISKIASFQKRIFTPKVLFNINNELIKIKKQGE